LNPIYPNELLPRVFYDNKWNIGPNSSVKDFLLFYPIVFSRSAGTYFRDQLVSTCGQHGFYPEIKHESINAFSILKLVEKDIGISVMPTSITQGYNLQVEYFEIKELNIPLNMVLSYRTDLDTELPKLIAQIVNQQALHQ